MTEQTQVYFLPKQIAKHIPQVCPLFIVTVNLVTTGTFIEEGARVKYLGGQTAWHNQNMNADLIQDW